MKKRSNKNYLVYLTVLVAALFGMSGCSLINNDEGDCSSTYKVRFRYDMNMKYADAFPHEVNAVHLYVLDSNNNVIWEGDESGDELSSENYEMDVDVTPGVYSLLAWCTTNEKNSYSWNTVNYTGKNKSIVLSDLACVLNEDDRAQSASVGSTQQIYVNHELDDLYHGLLTNVTFPSSEGEHTITVPLTKNTNRVRVVLQHISGEPINVDDFTFQMTADNSHLLHDNSVVDGHDVLYEPWHTASATSETASKADGDTSVNVAVAEITTSRLVTEDNPRLTVTNKQTGETVFSIPVKDYALMVKGYENRQMDDQEYLDRQDEYNMTFFLDDGNRWVSSYIYINSWRVVLQNSGL